MNTKNRQQKVVWNESGDCRAISISREGRGKRGRGASRRSLKRSTGFLLHRRMGKYATGQMMNVKCAIN